MLQRPRKLIKAIGKKKNPQLMNDLFPHLYPLFTDNMIPDFKFAILHVNFIELFDTFNIF